MLFHFTPHIYTLGELLKEEGSQTRNWQSTGFQVKNQSLSLTKRRIETGLREQGAEEGNWTKYTGSNTRLEKISERGAS
jgi:hypothetical protein